MQWFTGATGPEDPASRVPPHRRHLAGIAIFGGYLAQVARLHPEAAMPELHRSDRLLLDAASMRARDGDEKFFAGLGGGGSRICDSFAGR